MSTDISIKYQLNELVKVRVASPPGHFRTPTYIQGKTGQIGALCGVFHDPESLAHGGSGLPKQPLYRVVFKQSDVWTRYQGPSKDKILVDIYQHWLEPVEAPSKP